MNTLIAKALGALYIKKCEYFHEKIRIGKGLKLYCKLEIMGNGSVYVGQNCTVSGIRGDSSQYVTIYTHSPKAVIKIGNNASLFAARFSSKFSLTIGDDALIEESGIADTDFHSLDTSRAEPVEESQKCRVNIGNRVSIGAKSQIGKGVTIGDDTVICPGSIIVKSVPSGVMVFGNPARFLNLANRDQTG